MLEPLYTADEMRTAEAGHDVGALMELAGAAVARHALRAFPDARRFSVVCGGGANGGDARIAARVLREAGRDAVEDLDERADVIVDGLFGTGFHGPPRVEAADLIERMNAAAAPVVSVDLPSGVDASTGEVAGPAVDAALTVAFHGRKVGHVVAPGRFQAGEVVVEDIGLAAAETRNCRATRELLKLVPRRGERDTKYSAGAVLVVGGSPGLTGAVCLAAEAAFRADAGYVTICAPRESLPVIEARVLEAVKRPLEEVREAAERAGAVALGPGLGRASEALELVRSLLAELELPVVVDADALFELEPDAWPGPRVLTPHAGELGRLLGKASGWVDEHRLAAAGLAAERYGAVVLLKGADTIIAAPGKGVIVSDHGPPSLATAGTGDVLTGVVAAFLAKGMEPRLAAAAAAVAHGAAATAAPSQAGLVASDVVAALPYALG